MIVLAETNWKQISNYNFGFVIIAFDTFQPMLRKSFIKRNNWDRRHAVYISNNYSDICEKLHYISHISHTLLSLLLVHEGLFTKWEMN